MRNLRTWAYEKLRGSEKFFKADMVYLAKGGFWITVGQAVSNILSLLLVIAFANLLPKETYGLYRYILSLAGVLNIFTLTGMNSAVTRAVAAGDEGAFRTSTRYQLKWNLLMLVAFWVLGGYYFMNGNMMFAFSFAILGVFVPFTLALNTYGAYLDGKREFQMASIATIASTFVYALGIALALFLTKDVVWLVAAYAITTFISTLFFYLVTVRKYRAPASGTSESLTYGRELTFIGFVGPIVSQIDKIIITHFWGPAQLAVYSLAMAVPDKVTGLIKDWVGIGLPKFATKTLEELDSVFYKRITQGALIGVLVAIGYIVTAPYLFHYLLPQYLDSVFYSQILAISFVFAMPNRYISLLLVSQKFSRRIFVNSISQSVIKIILYILLGVWGGLLGLIIVQVLYSFISLLINIFVWKTKKPLPA